MAQRIALMNFDSFGCCDHYLLNKRNVYDRNSILVTRLINTGLLYIISIETRNINCFPKLKNQVL